MDGVRLVVSWCAGGRGCVRGCGGGVGLVRCPRRGRGFRSARLRWASRQRGCLLPSLWGCPARCRLSHRRRASLRPRPRRGLFACVVAWPFFCIQSANHSLQETEMHRPQRKPGQNRNCAGGWTPAQRRERLRRGHSRPPWAGSVRFQLRYRKGNRLPQIGQYRQYSLTGYPQKGQRGPSGACTMTTSYSVRFIGNYLLTFRKSRGKILSKSVMSPMARRILSRCPRLRLLQAFSG